MQSVFYKGFRRQAMHRCVYKLFVAYIAKQKNYINYNMQFFFCLKRMLFKSPLSVFHTKFQLAIFSGDVSNYAEMDVQLQFGSLRLYCSTPSLLFSSNYKHKPELEKCINFFPTISRCSNVDYILRSEKGGFYPKKRKRTRDKSEQTARRLLFDQQRSKEQSK